MKVITLFISIFLFTGLDAQETLLPYHWANDYIEYFIVRGDLNDLNKLNRPFSRTVVTKALLKIDLETANLSPKEKEMIRLLLREFEFEGRQLTEKETGGGWLQLMNKALKAFGQGSEEAAAFKAGGFARIDHNSFSSNDSSATAFQFNPNATLAWQDLLTLRLNIRIFNEAAPNYIGKKFAGVYSFTEQSYISLNTNWFGLKFGRDYLQLGPGQTGQLLFSDNSRPFDMYHIRLGKSALQFSFWGVLLDDISTAGTESAKFAPTAERFLNGHRLSFTIADRYRFAISEVIIYGGPYQGFDLGLVNPLMFYHGYNLNTTGNDANTLYNFEWDLYLRDNLELYGEFLLDDFQIDNKSPGDLEPNELGLLAGVKWSQPFGLQASLINAEYVQVRNRTYNVQLNPWEKYLHRNDVIGYTLGNNLERYFAQFNWWVLPELQIGLRTDIIRQGEGSVQGAFNTDFLNYTVKEGYDEPFPFGTVESDLSFGLNIFYRPANYGFIEIDLSNHSLKNLGHISGNDENDFRIMARLWLQWDYIYKEKK